MNIEHIANEALRLDSKDRAILAETIWESLEEPYIVVPDASDKDSVKLAKQQQFPLSKKSQPPKGLPGTARRGIR